VEIAFSRDRAHPRVVADGAPQPEPDGEPDRGICAEHGSCRVQRVMCGQCGWPSAMVAQEGMRLLRFGCHWCGKTTVGVVDPTIRRTVIF
jgi:hypothetical protein